MRKGERRKSRKDRKSVLGTVLAGTLLLGAFAGLCGCGGAQNGSGADAGSLFGQTDGTEAAEAAWNEEDGTPVAYLGGETVYLEEALFYTRMLQEQWEQAYYQDFGSGMWQQEAADDGRTLEDVLKGDVMSLLAELHLLCAHAEEYGAQLTEEDQKGIAQRAQRFMESNTPEVLEAAGATEESVAHYLTRNELAARTAQQIKEACEPELDEDAARVGRLTYCLFSVRGTYDLEGNHTPFTEEEIAEIGREAQEFLLDNLDSIFDFAEKYRNERKEEKKRPWTREDEEELITLFQGAATARQIAAKLNRPTREVEKRLIRLGLLSEAED